MNESKGPSSLVMGLALFSMFFGSGNLIFPLMLGAKYEGYFWVCALGFIITAVLLPTLGILAMIPAKGDYEKLFLGLAQKKYYQWFVFIVLAFWIPLGSGPRCILLAHASIHTYVDIMPPIWIFSLLFLFLTYICVKNKNKLITILGKVLTPIMLLSILFIVIASLSQPSLIKPDIDKSTVFLESLKAGYYTQDLIAAIFFSSTLVHMISKNSLSKKEKIRRLFRAGLIAVGLLTLLYTCLMASSAVHGQALHSLSGEKLVSALAKISLGNSLGMISALAVSLACFTTEIALVFVFATFLNDSILPHQPQRALFLTLGIIWVFSLLDFHGLMSVIAPAMQVIYPVLLFLVMRFLLISKTIEPRHP